MGGIFASDYAETPYWWRAAAPVRVEAELPSKVDVAIVGGGFTGLNAAFSLAKAGRSVVVLDAGPIGFGASTRNAGFVGRVLKHSLGELVAHHGEQRAAALYREAEAAYDFVFERVSSENLDCHLVKGGRLILSYSKAQLQGVLSELALKQRLLGEEFEQIDPAEISRELKTQSFAGGVRIANSATIHPALYCAGLLRSARDAGATLISHTPMIAISGERGRFSVSTPRGTIAARDVVLATNGYSAGAVPGWFRRRLVPFEGFMVASEEMAPAELDALLAQDRSIVDGRINLAFFRRSPDGRRVLFGSRTAMRHGGDLREVAKAIWSDAVKIIPALEQHRIAHCWSGQCAGTFDFNPHAGVHEGIHYALGYNFSGIAMATHLGALTARSVMGQPARSVFASGAFPTAPFYTGKPWFMPLAMKWFDLQDRRTIGRKAP